MGKKGGKTRWTLREERRLLEFAAVRTPVEDASEKLKRSVDSILTNANGHFTELVRECRAED